VFAPTPLCRLSLVVAKRGCAISASAWCGHAKNTLTRSRSSSVSVSPGSKSSWSTTPPPAASVVSATATRPPAKKNGMYPHVRSSGPTPRTAASSTAARASACCVCTAPFGSAVEPDVKTMVASSSGPTATGAAGAPPTAEESTGERSTGAPSAGVSSQTTSRSVGIGLAASSVAG
jgi:hypothetical protein